MTVIVKTVTRLTVGLILIYGIYIVLQGHISPGGGFAGGIIVALSFIHLMLAFGKDAVLKKIRQSRGLILSSLGALAFLFLAAKPGVASELAAALMVGSGLLVIFLTLVLLTGTKEGK